MCKVARIVENVIGTSGFEIFDREAARYDAWFDSERGNALFDSEVLCLRQLSTDLPRPWLEVGVGTGRFAEALGIEVGVDPSRAALEYAARRGIRVLPALGQALPFEDGEFRAVFVIVTICFADDPAGLLREAARVAGGEGAVVLGIVPVGSPWERSYAEKGRAGHTFYSQARFFSLDELERLARSAGLSFERSVSTLFQKPGDGPFEVEPPREGSHDEAGFVAVLCRRRPESHSGGPADRSASDPGDREMEPLVCMKDNVEVDRENPRCRHPSSQCPFREYCRVREAQRAKEKEQRG